MSSLSGAGFDFNLEYGEAGELETEGALRHGTFETKHKTYLDDQFYVEYEQLPHHSTETGVYVPSGIAISTAKYWSFVIGDTGVIVIVPTERVRAAARRAHKDQANHRHCESDNPTNGVMVSFADFLRHTT